MICIHLLAALAGQAVWWGGGGVQESSALGTPGRRRSTSMALLQTSELGHLL